MCYNAAFPKSQEVEALLGQDVKISNDIKEIHSVSGFAYPKIPVLTTENHKEVQTFNWGLIPTWCKDEETASKLRSITLNAKSETVFEKPSFRGAIKQHRCLIFTNGFYEWRDFNKKKYPYFIHLKNQNTFAFGGIYESWVNKETGEILNTCSILTTEANPLMAEIHNTKKRMPLIFNKEQMYNWIQPNITEEDINKLMLPFDEKQMEAHSISKLITSRKESPNQPMVKENFVYEELPGL